eukprot:6485572-Amphidinium_carterae.1
MPCFGSRRAGVRLGHQEHRNGSYQGLRFSLAAGAMENGGDPPGTRRSASGRLIDCKSGRFMTDPNKVKKVSSSRRANSRRSAASEKTADRSRSLGEELDNQQHQQHVDEQQQVVGVP